MSMHKPAPTRFVGIDLHKKYLVAFAYDARLNPVLGPQRVPLDELDAWRQKHLASGDAVVLEMTTNTWALYDDLAPHVHSVTVVHPPHVPQITQARVMNDRIAAETLARLHAKGEIVGIWIPPDNVRDLRALLAQRRKMVRLATQAKNRLHAVLHRHHLPPPQGSPFAPDKKTWRLREWWLALPVSEPERVRIRCDLDTLAFAQRQIADMEACLTRLAAQDERVPLLIQSTGISLINALTALAAIGDIARFPSARKLVGYAGLGAAVHDSGETYRSGRITKAGRRELRTVGVEAAQTAVNTDPYWRAEFLRLEPRLGRNKAIVAIARKLLIVIWHVLTDQVADRHAEAARVARKLMQHAYRLGRANRQPGQSCGQYVRAQLDRLGLGRELTAIPWGKRTIPLPPSTLGEPKAEGLPTG